MSHSDTVTQWLFQKLIVLDRSKVDSLGAFQPSFVTIHISPEVLHLYCPSYYVTQSHSDFSKIHEVLIETNLVVKKKNLPSDAFYKAVLIRQSRRKSTVNDANDDSDYDDIVDSDD